MTNVERTRAARSTSGADAGTPEATETEILATDGADLRLQRSHRGVQRRREA